LRRVDDEAADYASGIHATRHREAAMTEADELRRRAESLLTMAIKAREQGQFDNADSLIAEASKFLNEADALEAQQTADLEKKE
jgi:hypothetical protein